MGKTHDTIDPKIREFIEAQHVFFVATAPRSPDAHLNLSPKGRDGLALIDERTVAYLDWVGSGAETIAHLRDDGRIVMMMCAFDGAPKILRLHGRGEAVEPQDPRFAALRARFPERPPARAIIVVSVTRVSTSCGYGVPLHEYRGDREALDAWAQKKGPEGLDRYQRDNNRVSIDGLPALRWLEE